MKTIITTLFLLLSSSVIFPSQAETILTGTVEKVWEDGFKLRTEDRTVKVDSWDIYGDNTAKNVVVGQELTVTGEFGGRDFDAFSIEEANVSPQE